MMILKGFRKNWMLASNKDAVNKKIVSRVKNRIICKKKKEFMQFDCIQIPFLLQNP